MAVRLGQVVVAKVKLHNMKLYSFLVVIVLFQLGHSQDSLDDLLDKYNSNNVPYIAVEAIDINNPNIVLLDARAIEEYQVSHLKNAIHVGYDDFAVEMVNDYVADKESDIIVYCSLGIRSEVVANKLIEAGYTNVKNLYGGIFEWKNQNRKVYNFNDQATDSVHAFSKPWGKWLKSGIKVYSKD